MLVAKHLQYAFTNTSTLIFLAPFQPPPPPVCSFFNLSSAPLSLFETQTLGLSPKHVFPPSPTHYQEANKDLGIFYRRLGLSYLFRNEPPNPLYNHKIYVPNPTFRPIKPLIVRTAVMELVIPARNIINKPPDSKSSPRHDRFLKSFLTISTNKSLITMLADKNLGLVLLDRPHYHCLVLKMLENDSFRSLGPINAVYYTLLDYMGRYQQFLSRWFSKFNKFEQKHLQRDFLLSSKKLPEFYALPKLHKGIPVGINPDLAMRPIVGAPSWLTTNLSILVGCYLEPIFSNHPLYPRDSRAAISIIEKFYSEEPFRLFSLDVMALYPSMDIQDTVAAMHDLLLLFPQLPAWLPSAVEFILTTMLFHYNNTVYKQLNGMAMGTNMAVLVAVAYLHVRLELNPLIINARQTSLSLYLRYVDDIVGTWTGSMNDFEALCNELQTIIPGIRFTIVLDNPLPFLDLLLHPHRHNITISCYQKSSNSYSYLSRISHHPAALKRGFIKGELIRYVRNSSKNTDFVKMRWYFWHRLLARGYDGNFLKPIFRTVLYSNRASYLDNSLKAVPQQVIALSTRYSPTIASLELPARLRSHSFTRIADCFPPEKRPRILLCLKSNPSIALLARKTGSSGSVSLPAAS